MVTALLAIAALVALSVTALQHSLVHIKLTRRRRGPAHAPPVSILKPLKGIDDGLEANLTSIIEQDYPGRFEVILGTADPNDPALDVVQRLRRRFPEVAIRTVSGRAGDGLNPKVANLQGMIDLAEHDTLLISDSNVRVRPHYLASIAAELSDPEVGLVCNLVAGDGERTLGASLENLHLNSWIVGAVATSEVCRHPVVIGKSMLLRRSDLEALGGLDAVEDVLGEDYLLGRRYAAAGHKIVVSPHVVATINEQWGMRRFLSRHLRWTQMRRWITPWLYAFEPLIHPVPLLAALAFVLALGADAHAYPVWAWMVAIALAVGTKVASDSLLSRRLAGHWPTVSGMLAVPFKDLLVFALWFWAWKHRSVQWRGQTLRIGPGSALSHEVPDTFELPRPA